MSAGGSGTWDDFAGSVEAVVERAQQGEKRSLEEFLRAMWKSLTMHRGEPPTYSLLGHVVEESIDLNPPPYDDSWSQRAKVPTNPWVVRLGHPQFFTPERLSQMEAERAQTTDFEVLERTILFLIADLHSMASGQTKPSIDGLSWDSPRGHRWQHWELAPYLDAAERGFLAIVDRGGFQGTDETHCNWATLAVFLMSGMNFD